MRGAEERVLRGLFRRMQNLAYCTQLQTVVMLQFENHPLARRQLLERTIDAIAQLTTHQLLLGIRAAAPIWHLVKEAVFFSGAIRRYRSVFFPNLFFTEMIEAEVGNDAVDPSVEGALESEPS